MVGTTQERIKATKLAIEIIWAEFPLFVIQ